MLFLFTSKDCPKCKQLKETLKEKYIEKDIDTEDGLADYHFYNNNNRLGVPMLIEVDDKEQYIRDLTGSSKEKGE